MYKKTCHCGLCPYITEVNNRLTVVGDDNRLVWELITGSVLPHNATLLFLDAVNFIVVKHQCSILYSEILSSDLIQNINKIEVLFYDSRVSSM